MDWKIPIRWRIFSFLFCFGFLAYVQQKTITVAAARIMPELHLSQMQIGFLEQAFVIGYALCQLPGGILGQKIGARLTFVITGLSAFAATVATPIAPLVLSGQLLFAALLGAQLLLGCSHGALFPVSAGLFEAWFPPSRWSLVQGLQTMALGFGAATVPPLVATLMLLVGWQLALLWISLPALVLIALWGWYARNTPKEHPAVSAGELQAIGHRGAVHASVNVKQLLRLARNRNVILLFLAYMSMNYTYYLLSNWVFLYLVEERGFSVLHSGWLAALPPLAAAVGAGVGGILTAVFTQRYGDRWGYRMVPLMALPAAAALLIMVVAAPNPYVAVLALAGCFGAVELTEAPFWAAGMNIGRGDTMAVCGIMNTGGNLGGIISLPIIGYLTGQHAWRVCFLIGGALAILSAACWLWITIVAPTGSIQPLPQSGDSSAHVPSAF